MCFIFLTASALLVGSVAERATQAFTGNCTDMDAEWLMRSFWKIDWIGGKQVPRSEICAEVRSWLSSERRYLNRVTITLGNFPRLAETGYSQTAGRRSASITGGVIGGQVRDRCGARRGDLGPRSGI
jgi:hypothetical protein